MVISSKSHVVKVRKVGNSLGITLPKEVLGKLNVKEGDQVYIEETKEGLHLTAYDPDFEESMDIVKRLANKYPNLFRELAK